LGDIFGYIRKHIDGGITGIRFGVIVLFARDRPGKQADEQIYKESHPIFLSSRDCERDYRLETESWQVFGFLPVLLLA
jgi:hypothetical protein